jgi:hypothetical protein
MRRLFIPLMLLLSAGCFASTSDTTGQSGALQGLGAGLPALPGARQSAMAVDIPLAGSFFGSSQHAQVSATDGLLVPAAGELAWAIYGFSPGADPALSLTVNHAPQADTQVYIGLADYGAGRWLLHGPYGADPPADIETQFDLTSGADYVNDSGALYCCVIAWAPSGGDPQGEIVHSLTLTSDQPPVETFSISGTIFNGDGTPASGMPLALLSGSEEQDNFTTGVDGTYSFNGLFPGDYEVQPQVDAATDVDPNHALALIEDQNITGIDIKVAPYLSVSGRVMITAAEPLSDVPVLLVAADDQLCSTDSDGYYSFSAGCGADLSAGDHYAITALLAGYSMAPNSIIGDMPDVDLTDADFIATADGPTFNVSGNVSAEGGAAKADLRVWLSGFGSTYTDALGNFIFAGVPVGSYTLAPTGTCEPATIDVVIVDTSISSLNMVYQGPGYEVTGTISPGSNFLPIDYIGVVCAPYGMVYTDKLGKFKFQDIPNGSYNIDPTENTTPGSQLAVVFNASVGGINFAH